MKRQERLQGTPSPAYGRATIIALLLLSLTIWVFPSDWVRRHFMWHYADQPSAESVQLQGSIVPIRLLDIEDSLVDTGHGEVQFIEAIAIRELPETAPTEDLDPEPEAPASSRSDINWSYDPFANGFSGLEELLEAAVDWEPGDPREDLVRSLGFGELLFSASVDTTGWMWRTRSFVALQEKIFREQSPEWSVEARAEWMERHEIWVKFFGDDGEWP